MQSFECGASDSSTHHYRDNRTSRDGFQGTNQCPNSKKICLTLETKKVLTLRPGNDKAREAYSATF